MGYDMYMVGKDGSELPETPWKDDGFGVESFPDEYFRLNIFGMQDMRRFMTHAAMLCIIDYPRFPKREGMSEEEYAKACRKVTDYSAMTPTGIPIHKLGSNDGWLVTPGEIASALLMLKNTIGDTPEDIRAAVMAEESDDPEGNERWAVIVAAWVDFLRRAARHGGFRVF